MLADRLHLKPCAAWLLWLYPCETGTGGKRSESELAMVAGWILTHLEGWAPQFGGVLGASVRGMLSLWKKPTC